jgi:hypothetical protein
MRLQMHLELHVFLFFENPFFFTVVVFTACFGPVALSIGLSKGCYLNACTSHLYQTLVLPKLICTTP